MTSITSEELEPAIQKAKSFGEDSVLANEVGATKSKVMRYSSKSDQYLVETINGKHTKCAPFQSLKWAVTAYNNFKI